MPASRFASTAVWFPINGSCPSRSQSPTAESDQMSPAGVIVPARSCSGAIQRGVPGTFVYLVNADSTVSVRKVTLGVTNGERVEIVSGLDPGDRVVVDGADKLRDGAKVNLRQDDQATPSAAPQAQPRPDESRPDAAARNGQRNGAHRRSQNGARQGGQQGGQ